MIPLRSRSDSLTFTPRLSAIGSETNFSRSPVVLTPNFISMLTLDIPFKTILIGNSKIVEALAQDDRTLILTPQPIPPGGPTETNITFLDERNAQISSINVSIDEGGAASRI